MEYLSQALALAEEVLKISSSLQLTGQPKLAEEEVDAFAALLEKRVPMIEKLNQLLKQDTSGDKDMKRKIDEVLSKILECEKEHQRIMAHLKKSVTSSLREARSGQKLNQAYAHPYDGLTRGLLDTSQ